jgi:hypothetical protein
VTCTRRARPAYAALLLLAGLAAIAPGRARADEPYPLLVNRFGELCTMCEATVACRAGGPPPASVAELAAPGAPPYTLYHFQTKDFWGQVATIVKYLERWIRPVVREERPVIVYTAGPDRRRRATTATLSLDPALIEAAGRRIDRRTSAWQSASGEPVGSCLRVPLRETLTWLKTTGAWPGADAP